MDQQTLLLIGVAVLLVLLLLTIFFLLIFSGLVTPITVKTCKPSFGELEIAYKYEKGAYKNCGILFTEVYAIAPNNHSVGIYYDDPEKVQEPELRYAVASVLKNSGDNAQSKNYYEIKEKLLKNGFKIKTLPLVENVVHSTFPRKSMISCIVAIYRVYPKIKAYLQENKLCAYPAIEYYTDDEINFAFPLSKQEQFFVPEAIEDK